MKERTDLIEKELQTDVEYNWYDIVDCLELSYLLKGDIRVSNVEELIQECANDGINTWGIFIKYLYDKYRISKCDSMYNFVNQEIEFYTEKFIQRFFTRSKEEIRNLIESGALDDLEEFNKMNKKEQEYIIDYWVENYDKDI